MSKSNDCSNCKRVSSNDTGYPQRMSDGRIFTDYNTRCAQVANMRASSKAATSFDFRNYMTRNANDIIMQNRMNVMKDNRCVPCYNFKEDGTMVPEESKVVCNARVCSVAPYKANGVGQGRDYGSSRSVVAFYPIEGVAPSKYDKYGALL